MFATEVATIIVVYGAGAALGAGNVDTAALGQGLVGVFVFFICKSGHANSRMVVCVGPLSPPI